MHLIVGLGNIGEKYQLTRHNIGFMVIDEMTKNLSSSNINNPNFQSTLLKSGYNLFSKPITYMNNSGIGGGHGGHNGLKSLDAHITKEYIRVRVGIGKPADKSDVANYVLSNFSKEELNKLQDIIPHIIKAIEALKVEEIDYVKSKFTLK